MPNITFRIKFERVERPRITKDYVNLIVLRDTRFSTGIVFLRSQRAIDVSREYGFPIHCGPFGLVFGLSWLSRAV